MFSDGYFTAYAILDHTMTLRWKGCNTPISTVEAWIEQLLDEYYTLDPNEDMDDDGIINNQDNCPEHFNPEQSDIDFDYIGAPWSKKIKVNDDLTLNMEKNCVGNGGFSLRSLILTEITSKINYKNYVNHT